jgi:hypothetical protein
MPMTELPGLVGLAVFAFVVSVRVTDIPMPPRCGAAPSSSRIAKGR